MTILGSAIAIRALNVSFRANNSAAAFAVLKGISLTVQPGELLAVVGPSGCGKTTLLRTVGGLLNADTSNVEISGEITVGGVPPSDAKKSRQFGFAFQNPVLLAWRSALANIMLPLELSGRSDAEARRAAERVAEMMEVKSFSDSMPHELSGGLRQRVNIARALVHGPSVLLLDEPFGALDDVTRSRLNFALLRTHRIDRPTILLVTHALSEACLLADRIVVLSDRPAVICREFVSSLPTERDSSTLEAPAYANLLRQVRGALFEAAPPE